jgi:ribose transport system ATP-binding protein
LEVERLGWYERLREVSFTVGRGEIVGLGGLDGQGQRDLLLALFGVLSGVTGTVRLDGREVRPTSPAAAKGAGVRMALIPEDRKTEGLLLPMSVSSNLSLAALPGLSRGGIVDGAAEAAAVEAMVRQLRIKIGDPADPVGTLSGGNQQKVVIGKWLMTEPRVILLNDPTRGIDVGTKQELYQLLRELADRGASILLYSTDYDELIGCCDKVLILYDGRIVRTLEGEAITETDIVASSLNIAAAEAERIAA